MPVTWYEQKQTGWKTILVLSLVLAALAIAVLAAERAGASGEARRMGWGLAAVFAVVILTNRMEIRVTERDVYVRWGWLVGKHVPFLGVESIEPEKIPWTRVGMKFTKGVSWFSVSPGPGLRFRLKNGRAVVIGTPDPDSLLRVLQGLRPDLVKPKAS